MSVLETSLTGNWECWTSNSLVSSNFKKLVLYLSPPKEYADER